ncbi:hypothetical protein LX92_04005 [Maribacter polysiphoniae]|uniref:Uncharacterized protein n=1 Tax=Maribacter polysiphoniae TaxID=429344 RepID=A0A316DT30_9FLAO|nr:hypothetical protein LX92_04005 [Maribacter polysiphoniae]
MVIGLLGGAKPVQFIQPRIYDDQRNKKPDDVYLEPHKRDFCNSDS